MFVLHNICSLSLCPLVVTLLKYLISHILQNFEISPDGRLVALCGRFGNIHLLTANTLEGVGQLKMNNQVSAVTFDNDGSRLFSHGGKCASFMPVHNSQSIDQSYVSHFHLT